MGASMTKRKFLWLVGKHYKLIVKAAARAAQNLETGKDSTQEIIARLLERKTYLSAHGDNKRLRNWLIQVAVNESRNIWRKKKGEDLANVNKAVELHGEPTPYVGKRMFFPNQEFIDGEDVGPPVALPRLVRKDPDPINFDVARALAKLSKAERYIAEACLMGNDSPEQIAEHLGLPAPVIRIRLALVKVFLEKELASYKVGKLQAKGG